MSNRQPAWLQRLRRIRWPLRPGRPRRPYRHSTRPTKGAPAGWRWAIRPDRSLGSSSRSSTSDS